MPYIFDRYRNVSTSQHIDEDGDISLKARNLQAHDLKIRGSSLRVSPEVLRYLDGSVEPKSRICVSREFCGDGCGGGCSVLDC